MASTFDLRKGDAGFPASAKGESFVLNNVIDFTECTGIVATNTVDLLDIPAGCAVDNVYAKIKTPCSTAMTCEIGDATDPNGWITAVTLSGTAGTITTGAGAYVTAGGKTYASETALVATIGGTTPGATGVIEVCAHVRRIFPD